MMDELQTLLTEEELEEIQQYQYQGDLNIDNAIARVKETNTEIGRLTELYDQKVEQLKADYEFRVNKLKKKNEWDLSNIHIVVKNSPDKKETQTQYKKQYLSGDVIIKKS